MGESVRLHDKISFSRRMALATRVIGKPISKLSPAKLALTGLFSMPFIQKASADVGLTDAYNSAVSSPVMKNAASDLRLLKSDLGSLIREISGDPIGYVSAHPYSTAGVLLGFGILEVLLVMKRHQSDKYQKRLIDDPRTSARKLIALCQKSKHAEIRAKAIERCKDLPEKVLLKIVEKETNQQVKDAAIRHKNFPESAVLKQINNAREARAAVLERLRSIPISEEDWINLLNKHDAEIREVLVHKLRNGSQKFSVGMAGKLFDYQYPEVKSAVLKMKEIPEDVFRKAIESNDTKIRLEAFDHPNMPGYLLKEHIKDVDTKVRALVLEHRNTPSDAIAKELHESYVISKYTAGNFDLDAIISILKHHSSQKAMEILENLEKVDPELTKKIGNI